VQVTAKPFKSKTEIVLWGHRMITGMSGGVSGFDVVYPDDLSRLIKEVIDSLLPYFDE
jgi:hypothetical protein